MATYHVDNNLYDGHAEGVCRVNGQDATHVKLAEAAESGDDAYNDYGISVWKTSDGSNLQRRRITDYVGATRLATVNAAWGNIPDATYSYEITVGSDANDGTSEGTGATGAWRTLQKAMDEVAAGDTVWVKAGRAHTDDDDADTYCAEIQTVGTITAPIFFIGYKTTKGDAETYRAAHPDLHPSNSALDEYRAVIDGNPNTLAQGIEVPDLTGAALYYVFKNIRVHNCTAQGFGLHHSVESRVTLKNCRSDANSIGVYGYQDVVESCCIDNNTLLGVPLMNKTIVFSCDVFNNGGDGLESTWRNAVVKNRIFGNGGHGFNASNGGCFEFVFGNTFDGDGKPAGKVAIYLNAAANPVVANNIIHDFAIGLKCNGGNPGDRFAVRNNLITDCTTPRDDFPEGMGDVIAADPKFVDEANGDYGLSWSSPAVGMGCPDGHDAGAESRDGRTYRRPRIQKREY